MTLRAAAASLAVLISFGSCAHQEPVTSAPDARSLAEAAASVPRQRHIVVIVLENEDARDALNASFMRDLASSGAVLTDYRAVAHPSQPNYIAMIAGSTQSVRTDRPVDLPGRHLGDLLEEHGLSWKVYAEGYPGDCFAGASRRTPDGDYVRRHVPFLDFTNVSRNPVRCNAHVFGGGQFDADVASGSLPTVAFYIPTNRHNGHDTGFDVADAWMRMRFGPVMRDPRLADVLFIVTFDESDDDPLNRVATILIGNHVRRGATSSAIYDHFSLLRTIECAAGVPTLDSRDATALAIHDVWQ